MTMLVFFILRQKVQELIGSIFEFNLFILSYLDLTGIELHAVDQ